MKKIMGLVFAICLFATSSVSHAVPSEELSTFVVNSAALEGLGLKVLNPKLEVYLGNLETQVLRGLEKNNFIFFFKKPGLLDLPGNSFYNRGGLALDFFMRISKGNSIADSEIIKRDVLFGGDMKNATTGVCGQIATIRSLVKLGLLKPTEAYKGKFINPKGFIWAKKFQNDPDGMTAGEIMDAHKGGGATDCKQFGPRDMGKKAIATEFLDQLSKLQNDPKKTWDCTISLFTENANGETTFAHAEQVTSMKALPNGGGTELTTSNGLTQGNKSTDVPADAGSNTWTAQPGADPAFKLSSSTDADVTKAIGAKPININFATYTCCAKP